jgi:hypothetical protein
VREKQQLYGTRYNKTPRFGIFFSHFAQQAGRRFRWWSDEIKPATTANATAIETAAYDEIERCEHYKRRCQLAGGVGCLVMQRVPTEPL